MSVETNRKSTIIALGIIAILTILRAIYLHYTFVDLTPDEAQYWLWSQYPDWSYYSKGPLVAWLISISTAMFGDTVCGVKFFALAGMAALSYMCFALARNWKGDKAGFYALALVNATPLLGVGGLLMVPDMPVAVLWVASLLVLISQAPMFSGWRRFIIIGFLIGLAGLAKYTAGLFYPLVFIYFLSNKHRRIWLFKPHIYVAGFISLLCLAPIFIWNWQNNFASFRHVLGQVNGQDNSYWLDTILNFLGGQAAVSGGFVFIFLLSYWLMTLFSKKEDKAQLFWLFSAPLFAFFCIKAFGAKVQPNWPVLAILVGFIGLSGWLTMRRKTVQILFIIAISISGVLTIVGHDTHILRHAGVDISAKKDPLKPALGWHGLGEVISWHMEIMPKDTLILTTRYQTASQLAFYVKQNKTRPEVLYVNPGYRRQNQFDYWDWPEDIATRVVLYINEADVLEPAVKQAFEKCVFFDRVESTRENPNGDKLVLKEASIYICSGYKGINRLMADKF